MKQTYELGNMITAFICGVGVGSALTFIVFVAMGF